VKKNDEKVNFSKFYIISMQRLIIVSYMQRLLSWNA